MQFDTAKLPAKKWLKLSMVMNFLAFNDARDEEAMERDGYPSDIVWGPKTAQILERCRREATTDPRCAAFVKTVGTAGPLVQSHPISMRLQECEAAWPPSGQQLHDLMVQWEREREAEERKRSGAEQVMENALFSGEVIFDGLRGGRHGKHELINIGLIENGDENGDEDGDEGEVQLKEDAPIVWMEDGFAAKSNEDGSLLTWAKVRVERASFVKWLPGATGEAEMAANEIHPEQEPNLSRTTHRTITRHAASRESARQAIAVVFPDGMPSTMRSQQRLNKINDYLTDNGLPKVSSSTFRRAQQKQ